MAHDHFQTEAEVYIAFDVGGTHIKHGLLTGEGTFISKGSYPTVCDTLEQFVGGMEKVIGEYSTEHSAAGIAVSMPGFIDVNTGYSERAGSIRVLDQKNLKEILEERTGLPVEMENDGNCAALAEKLNGNAVSCRNFICVTLGTGIGGGIFINGEIVHGASFRGGEFGFMFTPAYHPDRPHMHGNASTGGLIKMYKDLKGLTVDEKVGGETVFEEAEHDTAVKRLIEEWVKNISYGLYNLAVTLNPEKILIGGGISGREGLIEDIIQHARHYPYWDSFAVSVEPCRHKNDAGMLGALYHFISRAQKVEQPQ
ncbi:ROK family protein [Peribacillus sp. SCS-37]|uniref:ROK family protein n=1 Tax=Paraperibacillus esterisolvens TaxID=3115296 RepID=UPI0039060E2A